MIKNITLLGLCALVAACVTSGAGSSGSNMASGSGQAVAWKKVTGVTSTVNGMREVMKVKVDGRDVVAVLQWRSYNAAVDGAVTRWYGDMGSPPPKFVVDSLLISIDGRGVIVPNTKTRYLCSQWMNGLAHLGLYLKGKDLCIYLDVGDGAEAWSASYILNPATAALLSHNVQDGPSFHNAIDSP